MTQSSCCNYSSSIASADFHLPDEILSVIPTDPYDQLDLARKITSMAIACRVSRLESEAAGLRQKIVDKDHMAHELQERLSQLEDALRESDTRLREALDDNMRLTSERDALAITAKKLHRDLAKLEAFKKHLMKSLKDESSPAEAVDIMTCDQSVIHVSSLKEGSNGYMETNLVRGSTGMAVHDGHLHDWTHLLLDFPRTCHVGPDSRHAGQRSYVTPYITPRTTTPKEISTAGSSRGFTCAGSPKMTSGTTSPTKPKFEVRAALSSWSQQSSARSSPPRERSIPVRTPRVDGKEFFRQARSQLSYEQFSAFLTNIKELNSHKQSRKETLKKAEEIFGTDNKNLYLSFQGLLNRSMP
ncbi:uncharacterized protein At4g15545-like isoform X2 [Magnolia sinica]|uniref:uncharacterized protein At4g15545-like isoform X2 n=1 Tax=Magnolia sinica TaxID=86752 RepID=UPI00265992F5|nr:uncharacterized protein At4g15545-like isoform X2 [Magnolia sinica]